MKIIWSEKQIDLLNRLCPSVNILDDVGDQELLLIEDVVAEHLTLHCMDSKYNPTPEGELCESILDIIS